MSPAGAFCLCELYLQLCKLFVHGCELFAQGYKLFVQRCRQGCYSWENQACFISFHCHSVGTFAQDFLLTYPAFMTVQQLCDCLLQHYKSTLPLTPNPLTQRHSSYRCSITSSNDGEGPLPSSTATEEELMTRKKRLVSCLIELTQRFKDNNSVTWMSVIWLLWDECRALHTHFLTSKDGFIMHRFVVLLCCGK